jgi:hypothetical protein
VAYILLAVLLFIALAGITHLTFVATMLVTGLAGLVGGNGPVTSTITVV